MMHLALICNVVFLAVVLLAGSGTTHAQELVGEQLKLTGQWTGDHLRTTSMQEWDTKDDPQRGRVVGRIDSLNADTRTLHIGPILVEWTDATRLEGISLGELAPGRAIEAAGRLAGPAHLIANAFRNGAAATDVLQIRGTVTEEERQPGGARQLTVLGVPVEVPMSVYARGSGLTRRPDERRPAQQLTLMLWQRPLTIGGELKSESRYRGNFALRDGAKDDVFRLEHELQLEFFYPFTENVVFFLEGKALYQSELYREEGGDRKTLRAIERGESWVYVSNLLGSNFDLQIGRQNFLERRSWWWDKDIDALRIHYNSRHLHTELAVAEELGSVSTEEERNDPEDVDVFRLLGHTAWLWTKNQQLDAFFLYHNDHSHRQSVGQLVKKGREDPSDAELLWLGVRTSGKLDLNRFGEINYRLEGARVGGDETVFSFKKASSDLRRVSSRTERDVTGWALESGLTWETTLPGQPTLTLGYALGSGDRTPDRGTDHAFRQTGLHNNKDRFRGVNRFRYYGELLEPELSNLHLGTVAVGFRFWRASSVEFIYHLYHQFSPASSLRDVRLDADPQGKRRPIGQEWDLVLGLREWEHIDIELISGLFRAGSAYGPLSGETAYSALLKVKYNF